MIYEVAWTRALSLVIGSSTYAFTAMLLAFLLGIALGSALFSRVFGARRASPAAFGFVQLGIAGSAVLILPAFERLPDLLLQALDVSLAPGFVLTVQVLLAVSAMLAPTLLIGASFPCAVGVVARAARTVGLDVGRLYAVNTLGAIIGTVLAGFVLIPWVGAQSSVKLAVVVNLVVGVALVLLAAPTLRAWQSAAAAVLGVVIVAGVIAVPAWNPVVMASGVAVYARQYQRFAGRVGLARAFPASSLLYYRDGLSATVSVHREGETVFLRVNGKTDASTGLDMHTQLMVGHLPLLAHPAPKTVLIVGLASGVTVGAVLQHPVTRVDVVEIEPAMVEASRFFTRENRDPLRDPRVRLVVGDARNFLLNTSDRYDVIISEPSNPWIGGIAALFSAEFYALVRSRLAPGGIALQWVDGYTMHPEDLRMVARTFRTAFPATTVWHARAMADFILIGRVEPRPLELARLAAAWEASPGLRQDLTRLGFRSPPAVLGDFLLDEADATRYAEDARVNDDDRLPLEFSAPRSMYRDTGALNFRAVKAFKRQEFPALPPADRERMDEPTIRHDLGLVYLRKNLPTEATAQFQRALARDPTDIASRLELGRLQLRAGLAVRAIESFEAVRARDPQHPEAHHQLAVAYETQQMGGRVLELAERAVALAPDEPRYRLHLATLLQAHDRQDAAVPHYLAARRARPRDISVLDGLATAFLALNRGADAVTVLEEAIGYQPENPLLQERLGRAYLAVGRHPDAVAAFERAIASDPLLAVAHSDLAYALMLRGDLDAAAKAVDRALALDPGQAPTARLKAEITSRLRVR
jgi:spermidine synthase